jgi:hypothetical protein
MLSLSKRVRKEQYKGEMYFKCALTFAGVIKAEDNKGALAECGVTA